MIIIAIVTTGFNDDIGNGKIMIMTKKDNFDKKKCSDNAHDNYNKLTKKKDY